MTPNNSPRVQIVILNWNNASDTINCLKSLQNIDYENYEIILIDNASIDDSVEQILDKFHHLKIVKNSANLGVAGGRNVGIDIVIKQISENRHLAPEYILFLDNDATVDVEFITEMVSAARADHHIGVLGCKVYHMEKPASFQSAGGELHFHRGETVLRGMDEPDTGQYDQACDIDFALGCAFMISREALKNIGKFDSIFGIYWGEEVDWCIRAKNAGYRITYVPKARIWHRASRTTPGANYWQQKARNHMILMRRYATKLDWLIFILFFPIIFIKAAGYQMRHGKLKNLLHMIKGMMATIGACSRSKSR